MPVPTTPLPPRPLLREGVLARVREAIVDGTLAPDEQLRDTEIAAWLGVSRTPVREALLELGRAGLVRAQPGRSTVVAPLDAAGVRDAQAVVAAMHGLAVEAAVPRMSAADLDRMRAAHVAFDDAQRRGDVEAAAAADHAFHAVAVDACGNTAAQSVIRTYEPVLHRAERLRFASAEGRDSVARHAALLARCEARDAAGAAALARDTWLSLEIAEPADSPAPTHRPDEDPA